LDENNDDLMIHSSNDSYKKVADYLYTVRHCINHLYASEVKVRDTVIYGSEISLILLK
jgi:hypothetical protein